MSGRKEFGLKDRPPRSKPLHYRGCGLDDVYLVNGYTVHETDYGRGVSIENIDGLHCAIALHLIAHRKVLSPKEFRFLRKQLDMTQGELVAALGVTSQTVARYEKGQTEIAGPADSMVRVLYVLSLLPEERRLEILERVIELAKADIDEVTPEPALFRATEHGWAEAA